MSLFTPGCPICATLMRRSVSEQASPLEVDAWSHKKRYASFFAETLVPLLQGQLPHSYQSKGHRR